MNPTNSARHWAVLVGCCLLCIFGFAMPLLCFGVFVTPLVNYFGSSVTEVNMYFTFMTACAVLSCAFGSKLIERSVSGTIILTAALIAAGYILLAMFPSIVLVWVAGIIAGLCYPLCSSILVPIVISRWFTKSQGTFIGIAFALVGATGVIAGPLFTTSILSMGWQASLSIMGVMIFIVCTFVAIVLLRESPQAAGLQPYGFESEAEANLAATKTSGSADDEPEYRTMVFSGAFLLLAIAMIFSGFLGDYNTQVNTIAQKSGFTPQEAGIAFSCTSGGLFIGKISLGWIKDRIGGDKAVCIGCIAGACAFALLIIAILQQNIALLYVGCAICGLCTCLGSVAPALLAGETFGKRAYAEAVSHATAFVNAGMAIGAPLYSLSFDITESFAPVILACLVISLFTIFTAFSCVRLGKKLRSINAGE